jgi:hypothetical protein
MAETAGEHVRKQREAGHLFHGTSHEFEPGDELTPEGADDHGRTWEDLSQSGRVYATSNLQSAQFYANSAAYDGLSDHMLNLPGFGERYTELSGKKDRIYRVEHTGDILEPDENASVYHFDSLQADKLTVVEEHHWPSEEMKERVNKNLDQRPQGNRRPTR